MWPLNILLEETSAGFIQRGDIKEDAPASEALTWDRQLEKRPVTLVINTLSRTERLKSWHFKGPLLSLLWKHKERPRKGESSFYHPFCNRRNFLIVSLILSSHPHWSLRWSSQSLKRPGHRFWFKRYPHWLTACPTRLHVLPPKLKSEWLENCGFLPVVRERFV